MPKSSDDDGAAKANCIYTACVNLTGKDSSRCTFSKFLGTISILHLPSQPLTGDEHTNKQADAAANAPIYSCSHPLTVKDAQTAKNVTSNL